MWNPSIFCRSGDIAPTYEEMLKRYVQTAVHVNSTYQNTKWVLNEMMTGGSTVLPPSEFRGSRVKDFKHRLGQSKSMGAICAMFGEPYDAARFPEKSHTTAFYRDFCFDTTNDTVSDTV